MTKLTAYTPGNDGRTRTSFNMFGTVTGRTSPSSSKYVFSASKWARNFIKPGLGNYLVYLEFYSLGFERLISLKKLNKLNKLNKSANSPAHAEII